MWWHKFRPQLGDQRALCKLGGIWNLPTPQVLSSNICAHIYKFAKISYYFSFWSRKKCHLIRLNNFTFSSWTFVFHQFCFVQCVMFKKFNWVTVKTRCLDFSKRSILFLFHHRGTTFTMESLPFLHYACEHHFEKKASVVSGVYLHDGWPNYNLQTHHHILTCLNWIEVIWICGQS